MTQGSQTRALGRFHRDLHWMVPDFSLWLSKSTGIMFLPFYVYTNILKTSLHIWGQVMCTRSFPSGSDGKEFACYAGDLDSIPGWGRSPGEGNGNPLQHSCLENSMARGAWQATVHGVAKIGHNWATNTQFFSCWGRYAQIFSIDGVHDQKSLETTQPERSQKPSKTPPCFLGRPGASLGASAGLA